MIKYLIDHFKLRQRINAGYIFAGILIFFVIGITNFTFHKTTEDFRDFVSFSTKTRIDLLLTAQVAEIQRQTLIYAHYGHLSAADQVIRLYEILLDQIDQDIETDLPVSRPILSEIKVHLKNYHAAFLQVKQQRSLQQQLLNVDFRDDATKAERLIQELIALEEENPGLQLILKSVLNRVLLIEKNLFRYLDSLDSSYVLAGKQNFIDALSFLNALDHSGVAHSKLDQVFDRLDRYQHRFNESVQLTRGYLYLINVVMAAEAYEILYQSKKLSALLADEIAVKEHGFLANVNDALHLLLTMGTVLLLLLLLFSYVIRQSIIRPISRIAMTFRNLAQGVNNAPIPNYVVRDEIGELTEAAIAYRDMNARTEQLLQESMKLTRALEESNSELERSNDELEQFVHTVSHDLKSPLVASMGFISMMRKLADQGNYRLAIEKLEKVITSITRMEQLINDLLDLSRVGRIETEMNPIDLNVLLQQFAEHQSEELKKANFDLIIHPGLPVINGNESRLLQLFENILSNAIKYAHNTEQGPRLEIGAIHSDQQWLIFCQDNGEGIDPAFHQKIFGLFYRLSSHQGGSGIGLAIAKKVMKFHGGDIWIESSPGNGATFWLKFPLVKKVENENAP